MCIHEIYFEGNLFHFDSTSVYEGCFTKVLGKQFLRGKLLTYEYGDLSSLHALSRAYQIKPLTSGVSNKIMEE